MPLPLRLYLALAALSAPLWRLILWLRGRKGQDDVARAPERLGYFARPRPPGRLLWFHAASIGEAQSLVTLLGHLTDAHPEINVVLTTHTLASAQVLAARGLPPRVIHQFAPADFPGAVKRFLGYWRPDALIVAEVDLWPVMLIKARRAGLPMLLVNTQINARRFQRRRRMTRTNAFLFNIFDTILVQDDASLGRCLDLAVAARKLSVMGPLKAGADPLPDHPADRAALETQINGRPLWLAASTWPAEEPQILDAHRKALGLLPDLLLVIAPRQRTAADSTEAAARARFSPEAIARRSRSEPITPRTQVYIADTVGEMGLWYRLAPVAFVGKSLPPNSTTRMGGHNPFEPVALGVLVLHGPDVDSFADAYAALHAENGAILVKHAADLAEQVIAAQNPTYREPWLAGAARAQVANGDALRLCLAALSTVIAGLERPTE